MERPAVKTTLKVEKFLMQVATGESFRIIDLRGNYQTTVPGAIPTRFDPDIFYEEEGWTQQMLGVEFQEGQTVLLVCSSGTNSLEGVKLFQRKNPKSRFILLSLQDGMEAYQAYISEITRPFRNRERFMEELLDIRTPPQRFRHLVTGLLQQRQPKGWRRLFHPSSWL